MPIPWSDLKVRDKMPTETDPASCTFSWHPNDDVGFPWLCTRSPHTDGIHVASAGGIIRAVIHTHG